VRAGSRDSAGGVPSVHHQRRFPHECVDGMKRLALARRGGILCPTRAHTRSRPQEEGQPWAILAWTSPRGKARSASSPRGGELIERRVRTEPERFTVVLGDRPRARILLEASTDSEWVTRCLAARPPALADRPLARRHAPRQPAARLRRGRHHS
jgi:hypothetical protein